MEYNYNYSIEIGVACNDYSPKFAMYGSLVCSGNSLEELFDSASIEVIDQYGAKLAEKGLKDLDRLTQKAAKKEIINNWTVDALFYGV